MTKVYVKKIIVIRDGIFDYCALKKLIIRDGISELCTQEIHAMQLSIIALYLGKCVRAECSAAHPSDSSSFVTTAL